MAQVGYRWVFADGSATPTQTIAFAGSGQQSKTIQSSWAPKTTDLDRYPGWAAIDVSQPQAATSDKAVFTLICMPTPG